MASVTSGDDDGETILGIDIGGTKTALMATSRNTGRKVAMTQFATPSRMGPESFVALLHRESTAMLVGAGVHPLSVSAVGCAVPGQVDGSGTVIGAGNLGGWTRVPLRALLEEQWRTPAFVDQDANAGALGEMWLGAARELNDFVFLALGTGVGAGIVLNGRIHRGAHHAAGELGDLVLDPGALGRGPPDGHNLASQVGSRALRARARRATGEKMRASDVVPEAAADPRLRAVASDVASNLAATVIAIAALLDPEAIVFGGGTAADAEELMVRIRERMKGELWIEPVLILAALGEEAQLYGAVAGALAALDPNFVLGARGRG